MGSLDLSGTPSSFSSVSHGWCGWEVLSVKEWKKERGKPLPLRAGSGRFLVHRRSQVRLSWEVLIRNLSEMLVTVQADPSWLRWDPLILQDWVGERLLFSVQLFLVFCSVLGGCFLMFQICVFYRAEGVEWEFGEKKQAKQQQQIQNNKTVLYISEPVFFSYSLFCMIWVNKVCPDG